MPLGKTPIVVGGSHTDVRRLDLDICHGQACVTGTRTPVHQTVRMLAKGGTVEDLLSEYPSLSREDITGCLDYAANLAEE